MDMGKYEQLEVVAFCRQYPYWKKRAAEIANKIKTQRYDSQYSTRRNIHDDCVATAVITRDFYMKKIAIVEETAAEFGEWKESLIKHMCEGRSWAYLHDFYILPSFSKDSFYRVKKEFCKAIYDRKSDWRT